MQGRPQGNARPLTGASFVSADTSDVAFPLDTSASTPEAWCVEQLAALDHRLFVGPYVLIDAENTSPQRVSTRTEADAAVQADTAVAVAG